MKYAPNTPAKTPKDTAIEFTCNASFHRSLTLPATDKHGPLRVTYATTTNFDGENAQGLPVLLVCCPMAAPRTVVYRFNHMAETTGIRMILVDRPSVGGSTPVPLEQRVDVWIETVPVVLKALRVEHVALFAHSAGAIYLLNTLIRLPDILHPTRPFVAMQAPWVHWKHSGVGMLTLASKLPQPWIGNFGGVVKFVNTNIAPSVGFSSGVFESVANIFRDESTLVSDEGEKIKAAYGYDADVWKEVETLQTQYGQNEDSSGIGQEALLCLKKGGSYWGACDDYPTYIEALAQQLRGRRGDGAEGRDKLKIVAQFSETDIMIGKGGQVYFEECWSKADVSDVIEFQSVMVPGTNHETLVSPQKKGLVEIMDQLKATYAGPKDFASASSSAPHS